jgi:hypothetical protein
MVSGLVFYAGLGLLSLQGVFTKQNKPPFLSWVFFIIFGVLLALWYIFILLRISDSHLYKYSFVFGAIVTVVYLIGFSLRLVKKG